MKGSPRPLSHRVLGRIYLWRWWIVLVLFVALLVGLFLTGKLWLLIVGVVAIAVLTMRWGITASWVRGIDKADAAFQEGLDGK